MNMWDILGGALFAAVLAFLATAMLLLFIGNREIAIKNSTSYVIFAAAFMLVYYPSFSFVAANNAAVAAQKNAQIHKGERLSNGWIVVECRQGPDGNMYVSAGNSPLDVMSDNIHVLRVDPALCNRK